MAKPIIEAIDLTKAFGTVRALDKLDLAVPPGIIYALLGPNGAGKTTLIRVLATLLSPDGGAATVEGFDIHRQPNRVRERIGLAGQSAAVDEFLTGRENVEMVGLLYGLSRNEARRRTREILEQIELAEPADRAVQTYSGGMRRRLDLAASLVGRPSVMFLDEPTTGLDPASRLELWALIRELVGSGTTILLTTQYLDEADRLADRIGVIDRGRLIAEGTPNELKAQVGESAVEIVVDAADRERALDALREHGRIDVSTGGQTARLRLGASDGPQSLTTALHRLAAADLDVLDASLHRPTLDDVFLVLTGHQSSRDADAARRAA